MYQLRVIKKHKKDNGMHYERKIPENSEEKKKMVNIGLNN
jgi:hypothetical protein